MHELTIQELENQIRIIKQKLPSIDESIKTYTQMTKNYQAERDMLTNKLLDIESVIILLKKEEENDD